MIQGNAYVADISTPESTPGALACWAPICLIAVLISVLGAPLLALIVHFPRGDWRVSAPFYFGCLLEAAALPMALYHFRRPQAAAVDKVEGVDAGSAGNMTKSLGLSFCSSWG